MSSIPILKELQRLKSLHENVKANAMTFQPNEEDQKNLIIRNASIKLVSSALKKERSKLLLNERNFDKETEKCSTDNNPINRAQTAPTLHARMEFKQSPEDLQQLTQIPRPSTVNTTSNGKKNLFTNVLKKTTANDEFSECLKYQKIQQAKDAKKVFDALIQHYKGGVCCQFSPKRNFEVIDVNSLIVMPTHTGTIKLEDIGNIRKKDGIALIFDPSTNTDGSVVTIRVYYQKMIDLISEESCSKDFTFHSDGNYFGLQLTEDNNASLLSQLQHQHMQHHHQQQQQLDEEGHTHPHISSSVSSSSSNISKCSLPGWQGRPLLFIPSTRCSIEVIHIANKNNGTTSNMSSDSIIHHSQNNNAPQAIASFPASSSSSSTQVMKQPASTAFNLSKLRIFAVTAANAKASIKKLHEFCDEFFQVHTANLVVAGGISALNLAALHGNLEAVIQLVQSGANIDARNKGAKNHTALHEAVIGGHKDVVKYLLSKRPNQLLRDDLGCAPLHHACKLENIGIARLLINSEGGKRALLVSDNNDRKPIELCTSNFMKIRIEGAMRHFKIFVKPRVSIVDR